MAQGDAASGSALEMAYALAASAVATTAGVDPRVGLSSRDAQDRAGEVGPNELSAPGSAEGLAVGAPLGDAAVRSRPLRRVSQPRSSVRSAMVCSSWPDSFHWSARTSRRSTEASAHFKRSGMPPRRRPRSVATAVSGSRGSGPCPGRHRASPCRGRRTGRRSPDPGRPPRPGSQRPDRRILPETMSIEPDPVATGVGGSPVDGILGDERGRRQGRGSRSPRAPARRSAGSPPA